MLMALLLILSMAAAGLTGVVKDTSGGAVPGASVTIQTPSGAAPQTVISGSDGRFSFATVPDGAVLVVRAGGFAEQRQCKLTDLAEDAAPYFSIVLVRRAEDSIR